MRRSSLLLMFAVLASLVVSGPALAKPKPSDGGASGSISLTVHTHSSQFTDTLFPTSPLPFPITQTSTGTYSSIPCSEPAPFNDVALDLTPDYPGIDDPASVRHFVEVTLTPTQGNKGTVEGEITTILCVDGEESGDRIFFAFEGTYKQTGGELKVQGTFTITGGTGRFADITGGGTITGAITCLPFHNATCARLGAFADAVFTLQGTFSDPTV
ncbi:MAG: hypothetical protein M3203_16380 [Actinomycetota bacterium]|nr:hypothetical protein [Actinomycetota bacterium]